MGINDTFKSARAKLGKVTSQRQLTPGELGDLGLTLLFLFIYMGLSLLLTVAVQLVFHISSRLWALQWFSIILANLFGGILSQYIGSWLADPNKPHRTIFSAFTIFQVSLGFIGAFGAFFVGELFSNNFQPGLALNGTVNFLRLSAALAGWTDTAYAGTLFTFFCFVTLSAIVFNLINGVVVSEAQQALAEGIAPNKRKVTLNGLALITLFLLTNFFISPGFDGYERVPVRPEGQLLVAGVVLAWGLAAVLVFLFAGRLFDAIVVRVGRSPRGDVNVSAAAREIAKVLGMAVVALVLAVMGATWVIVCAPLEALPVPELGAYHEEGTPRPAAYAGFTCKTQAPTGDEFDKSVAGSWSNLSYARIDLDMAADCKASKPLNASRNYIVAIGETSQEHEGLAQASLADDRAAAAARLLLQRSPFWRGRVFVVNLGKAVVRPGALSTGSGDNTYAGERPIIVLSGYEAAHHGAINSWATFFQKLKDPTPSSQAVPAQKYFSQASRWLNAQGISKHFDASQCRFYELDSSGNVVGGTTNAPCTSISR